MVAESASRWFEELWIDAEVVGPEEIKWAEATWNSSKRGAPQGSRSYDSFFDALEDAENGVGGEWKFLLTRDQHSKSERAAIRKNEAEVVRKVDWQPQGRLDAFTNLSKRKKLGGHYISLHRGGRGKLYLKPLAFVGNLDLRAEDNSKVKVSYFSVLPWQGTDMPTLSNKELDKDGLLSERIFSLKDGNLFGRALDARTFADALRV